MLIFINGLFVLVCINLDEIRSTKFDIQNKITKNINKFKKSFDFSKFFVVQKILLKICMFFKNVD